MRNQILLLALFAFVAAQAWWHIPKGINGKVYVPSFVMNRVRLTNAKVAGANKAGASSLVQEDSELDLLLAQVAKHVYKKTIVKGDTFDISYKRKCVSLKVVYQKVAGDDIQSVVLSWPEKKALVVAYRGTQSVKNARADAKIIRAACRLGLKSEFFCGNTHRGFLRNYQAFKGQNKFVLDYAASHGVKQMFFTGHSLGAAIATVATTDMLVAMRTNKDNKVEHVRLSNIGSPPIGDKQFTNQFTALLADKQYKPSLSAAVFANNRGILFDPVTITYPSLGYHHIAKSTIQNCKPFCKITNPVSLHSGTTYIGSISKHHMGNKNYRIAKCRDTAAWLERLYGKKGKKSKGSKRTKGSKAPKVGKKAFKRALKAGLGRRVARKVAKKARKAYKKARKAGRSRKSAKKAAKKAAKRAAKKAARKKSARNIPVSPPTIEEVNSRLAKTLVDVEPNVKNWNEDYVPAVSTKTLSDAGRSHNNAVKTHRKVSRKLRASCNKKTCKLRK